MLGLKIHRELSIDAKHALEPQGGIGGHRLELADDPLNML